jgi:hypothetical protein
MPPITLNGDTGITTPMYNGSITANAVTPSVNMKNRIINGAMTITQRNGTSSVTPANGDYTLDRWRAGLSVSSKYSVQQDAGSVTPPAGFSDYLGITSLSAYTVGADDYFILQQPIEGFNWADLGYGTANAKTSTLSFWVRSSLTGTFGGSFTNSNYDYGYPFTYTISAANTWEYKTITIVGATAGTWVGATNGIGLRLLIGLGVGSNRSFTAGSWQAGNVQAATGATSVVGTNGATFYITGVQLEVGSTATSFDYRPYGTELALCQRYCQVISIRDNGIIGFNNSTTIGWFGYYPPVVMRTLPTLGTTGTASNYRILYAGGATACSVIPSMVSDQGTGFYRIEGTVASGLTAGQGSMLIGNNAAYNISFLAEL